MFVSHNAPWDQPHRGADEPAQPPEASRGRVVPLPGSAAARAIAAAARIDRAAQSMLEHAGQIAADSRRLEQCRAALVQRERHLRVAVDQLAGAQQRLRVEALRGAAIAAEAGAIQALIERGDVPACERLVRAATRR